MTRGYHIQSHLIAICLAGAFQVGFVVPMPNGIAAPQASAIDTDQNGTIDLAEAKAAASALFDKLDKDREGTLDIKELKGRLTKGELSAGDTDQDKTLTKDEYLAVVERAFKAADANNDGTLDKKELKSKAGRALLRLLK